MGRRRRPILWCSACYDEHRPLCDAAGLCFSVHGNGLEVRPALTASTEKSRSRPPAGIFGESQILLAADLVNVAFAD
jgi:hypothetical protein